jgi:hypothetical protein
LPQDRTWDSVRFGARTVTNGGESGARGCIQLRYICERGHRPVEHGVLEFDEIEVQWKQRHSDDRVQRMAECFLIVYMEKRKGQEVKQAAG